MRNLENWPLTFVLFLKQFDGPIPGCFRLTIIILLAQKHEVLINITDIAAHFVDGIYKLHGIET